LTVVEALGWPVQFPAVFMKNPEAHMRQVEGESGSQNKHALLSRQAMHEPLVAKEYLGSQREHLSWLLTTPDEHLGSIFASSFCLGRQTRPLLNMKYPGKQDEQTPSIKYDWQFAIGMLIIAHNFGEKE
jgi:hypothetical protein